MAPMNLFSAAWVFLALFSTVRISLQQTPTSSMTTMVSKSRSSFPTITMSNPAAWVDTSAVVPFSVVTNKIIITSAAPDSDPQIYLGASIAASAQAAAQSDCPMPDSPNCVSSIGSALNTDNALSGNSTLQSRLAPLLLVGTALAAMLSVVISSFRLDNPNGQVKFIQVEPAPYSSLASVQNSPSVIFVTASDDPNPVTVAMFASTTADGSTTPTSGSASLTGSIPFSTATASGNLIASGEIIFTLPTAAATPIESLLNVSATGSSCALIPTASSSSLASLRKRGGSFGWNSVVSDANAMWPAVAPGGDLQIIRTVTATQLPQFLNVVQTALQSVITAGEQIATMLLTSSGLTAVAAVLFFIALNYRYCINLDAFTFVIPTEALSTNSQSSRTTSAPCPPPTAAPNCNNCGGNAATSSASALCSGIQTKSFLWESCPCYDPGAYGYNPFNQQQLLQAAALALSLQTMAATASASGVTSMTTSARPATTVIGYPGCPCPDVPKVKLKGGTTD